VTTATAGWLAAAAGLFSLSQGQTTADRLARSDPLTVSADQFVTQGAWAPGVSCDLPGVTTLPSTASLTIIAILFAATDAA
jgi:hypothetical protein